MKWIIVLVALFVSGTLYAGDNDRTPNRQALERHIMPMPDTTGIYVGDGDSTGLYYYSLVPKGDIKGVLVLFPPNGQTLEEVIAINRILLNIARDSGVLSVIPSINHNLYLDRPTLGFINAICTEVMQSHKINRDRFVFGGFSLGGMNAIRYTELAYADKSGTAVRPAAVYGIDPPLDWARIYHSWLRAIEKNFSAPAVDEARYFIQRLNEEFGGTPEDHPDTYVRHSMYSRLSKGGGNAQYLKTVPVRIYSDPDIDWQLANRRVDYYDMNVLDAAAMINQLHLDGNERAELINALGKGCRPDGSRHPHSWSLAEPRECVAWILRCLQ